MANEKLRLTQILPTSFFDMMRDTKYFRMFQKVGFKEYLVLLAWGMDVKRCYDLMSTISKIGTSSIVNLEMEHLQISIIEDIIRKTLMLKIGSVSLKNLLEKIECKALFKKDKILGLET